MVHTPKHRAKSPDLSHSCTEDLFGTAGHVHRSPSARERFTKHMAGSSTGSFGRRPGSSSNNSYASRLIKSAASRQPGTFKASLSAHASQLGADSSELPVSSASQKGLADGCSAVSATNPASWFAANRVSNSSSGAAGPRPLHVLDDAGAAADSLPGLWRRSASEGRALFPRALALHQQSCAGGDGGADSQGSAAAAAAAAPGLPNSRNNSSSGTGLLSWALQDEIQQWEAREQQKQLRQQQGGQCHPWPEQPPAWMLPQQQQQQQWGAQSSSDTLVREQSLPCTSTTIPADCAIASSNGTSSHLFSLQGPTGNSSWANFAFGSATGTGTGQPGLQENQPDNGSLLQANSLGLTVRTDRAGGLSSPAGAAAPACTALGGSTAAVQLDQAADSSNSCSAAAAAPTTAGNSCGGIACSASSSSEAAGLRKTISAGGNCSPLHSSNSNNPYIASLQQQLTRLKMAHALITQEVVPETPPSAIAASVAILFDPSRSDHECSTYMQQQVQQQQQQQQQQHGQEQQPTAGQESVVPPTVAVDAQRDSSATFLLSRSADISVQPEAPAAAAAATASPDTTAPAAPAPTAAAAAAASGATPASQLAIRKSSTVSWPKASGEVLALLTESSSCGLSTTSSTHTHCTATGHHTSGDSADHQHHQATAHLAVAPAMARVDEDGELLDSQPTAAAAAAAAAATDSPAAAGIGGAEQVGGAAAGAEAQGLQAAALTHAGSDTTKPSNSSSPKPQRRNPGNVNPIGDAILVEQQQHQHQLLHQMLASPTATQQQQQQMSRTASGGDLQAYAQHFCYPSAAVAAGIASPRASSASGHLSPTATARLSTNGRLSTTGRHSQTATGSQADTNTGSTGRPLSATSTAVSAAATAAAAAAVAAVLSGTNQQLLTQACCPARCLTNTASTGRAVCTAAAAAAVAATGKAADQPQQQSGPAEPQPAQPKLLSAEAASGRPAPVGDSIHRQGGSSSGTEVLRTEINLRADWTSSGECVAAAAASAAAVEPPKQPQSPGRKGRGATQPKSPTARGGGRAAGRANTTPAAAGEGAGTAAARGGSGNSGRNSPRHCHNSPRRRDNSPLRASTAHQRVGSNTAASSSGGGSSGSSSSARGAQGSGSPKRSSGPNKPDWDSVPSVPNTSSGCQRSSSPLRNGSTARDRSPARSGCNSSAGGRDSSPARGGPHNSPTGSRSGRNPSSPSGYAAVLLRQQQQSANKAQVAAAAAATAAAAAAAEAFAAAAAVEAAAAAAEAQNCQSDSDNGSATVTGARDGSETEGHSAAAAAAAAQGLTGHLPRTPSHHCAADAEVAAAIAAAAARAVQQHRRHSLSRGCSPVPPLILPTEADLMPEHSRLGLETPEGPSPLPGYTPYALQPAHSTAEHSPSPSAAAASMGAAVGSAGVTAPAAATAAAAEPRAESPWGYTHRAVLPQGLLGSFVCIDGSSSQDAAAAAQHSSSSSAAGGGGGGSDSAAAAADARYAELLARLQTFMPALSAAASPAGDFETTWQVVKAELSALASAARLASQQAGRLEALDSEVVKLQRLLALVGKHIKAGAQQQQLYDLVRSFPAFAQHLDTTASEASTALPTPRSQPPQTPRMPATATAAAEAPAAPEQADNPLQQLIASLAAAAAAASNRAPASSSNNLSTAGACSHSGSTHEQRSASALSASVSSFGAAGAGGSGHSGSRSPTRSQSPTKQQPGWVNPLYGSTRRPSPERVRREAAGSSRAQQGSRSPGRGRSPSPVAERSGGSRAVAPPLKTLTPDESARLMGLYKVRTTPEKISYKTMWVPGKSLPASPHASPPRERRSPSPMSRSMQLSPRGSRAGDGIEAEIQRAATSSSRASDRERDEAAAGNLTARRRLCAIKEEGSSPSLTVDCGAGISAADTKRALDWLEQHFGGSTDSGSGPAMEAEQIVSALRSMLGAAAAAAADSDALGPRAASGSGTPIRSSISFAQDVEQQQRQRQLQQHGGCLGVSSSTSALHDTSSSSSSGARSSPAARALEIMQSPRTPGYYGPGHRSASPMGFVYRPKSAQGEQHQQQQQQQQQRQAQRRQSSDHMQAMSASWDNSPLVGTPWGSPSPRGGQAGAGNGNGSGSMGKGRSGRLAGSGALKAALGSGIGMMSGGGNGALLADDPAFQEACKMFRTRHQQQAAAGSFLNSNALPRVSSAAQQLAVRLSPTKDADAQTVANTIKLLVMTLQQHGVPLDLERVGTFTYSAAGRKLHVRILNGNLLVRTGGGYQDLLDALGKLPAPSSSTPASPSPAAAALTAANSMLAAAASISSPRTPVLAVGAGFNANSRSSDQDGLLAQQQRSSSSSSKCNSTSKQLHPGPSHVAAAGAAGTALPGAHTRLDLTNLHNSLFTRRSSGPLGSARTLDPASDAAGRSSGSAAAFEAAVQAAVAAAVEAAANAGLDDGMGTSGGGAAPAAGGSGATARQASRAALLGRVIAAKTAAGTLIEAGMCPPVPVQEEVGSPPAAASAVALADTLSEDDSQQ